VPNAPSDVDIHNSAAVPVVPLAPSPAQTAQPEAGLPESTEYGGPTGPEPTRFGDWERKGRCVDF
jgi:hypothetical protein